MSFFAHFLVKTKSRTRAFHDVCCSKPLTIHASRSCFKHFFRFQALQHAATFHCQEDWHDREELKPKPEEKCTERCAAASKGPWWMVKDFNHEKMFKKHIWEGHDVVGRVGPNGEAFAWCRKCMAGQKTKTRKVTGRSARQKRERVESRG